VTNDCSLFIQFYFKISDVIDHETFLDPPIRVVGGRSPTEGRVEVYLNGQWGTICKNSFDTRDAKVLCHSLGHGRYV
jgi:hypothetical protein